MVAVVVLMPPLVLARRRTGSRLRLRLRLWLRLRLRLRSCLLHLRSTAELGLRRWCALLRSWLLYLGSSLEPWLELLLRLLLRPRLLRPVLLLIAPSAPELRLCLRCLLLRLSLLRGLLLSRRSPTVLWLRWLYVLLRMVAGAPAFLTSRSRLPRLW